ncbi:MAG: MlaD family protein [Acidovorax sp.]|jgi:phospholipid/cholesterol/gamma-HCH transport system substrate-binding protein|uniref:MlaD family protein n=1 Tax=Acidovorax sp. TaxID=1872122 RepID=UPI000AF4A988|nr:MlaD family protein [Acidovorax sp.]MDH4427621.1 MlaD family protein [Acidovorax sp.]MDH4448538.1 MlaD family protein [Acidovorax sp.]MDH4464203.1 MlaD family protein [Acidovorax sp.]
MENKSHAMAAGIFVLVVAAMLAGLAVWLTRDNANYALYELSTKDGVGGLQPQAAVRYKGVAVGKVTRIGFDQQVPGNVLIRIAVSEQAPLSRTTFAVLGYQGVTGLAHILLDDSQQPYPELPPGPSGLPRLPLKASPFGKLAEQAPAILGQVEEATRRINRLLGDNNQQQLSEALANINQAAAGINTLTQRLDTTLTQRLDPALAALPPLAVDARQTLQSLRQAGDSVTTLATDFSETTRRLTADGGAIDQISVGTQALARAADQFSTATLPRLNRAADDTGRAARQIGRTATGVQDNPQLFIYGSGRIPPGPGEPGFAAP